MKLPYEEFDLSGVKTYPLRSRPEQGVAGAVRDAVQEGTGVDGLLKSLPGLLAAQDFKDVVAAIVTAKRDGKAIVWGLGAHVLKTGLSPVLVDLMERGFVSAIATNGAGIIHDFEIALSGGTSEDVDATLGPGTFGMAEETGTELNRAINEGVAQGLGLGQSVGKFLDAKQAVIRADQRGRHGVAPEDSGHRSCRGRHRHHSHAPAGVGRGASARAAFAISSISCRRCRDWSRACT